MAEQMTVAGVDFSANATDNTTWITTATLQGDVLEIVSCIRLPRKREDAHKELNKRLKALMSDDAVIALDFPFGVPKPESTEGMRGGWLRKGREAWVMGQQCPDAAGFERVRVETAMPGGC